ncbi:TetR/AcrR family transcriptional regulator [Virgibacillus oceani]|uniref:TetR family transcriptional regulator n=1 Tax=Virgibacillus oceani TaxID=1479511 RepID=A0A917HJ18_9BACI|nr:TetR/AcrR family transcriptional regulator [Virgibacillus oceani]GGG80224.1 TetR family transcriptional regulator [Virgibacillus oceani]
MGITQTFKNLDENKQQRILNAALKEFAENGYERASTNQIVKSAGIGKGMLFYYFTNKKELYHYLIDYALDIVMYKYLNMIDIDDPDMIERMKKAGQIKMKCFAENAEVFYFAGTFLLEDELDLPLPLKRKFEELYARGHSIIYENIDKTMFRDDADVDKIFQIIRWSMEGYENDLKKRLHGQNLTTINYDPIWEEFYEYMDILKLSFYRK